MSVHYKVPDGKELRIAISGKSGCGNTTISTLLAQTLGINLINFTFRQLAEEKGMSLADVIKAAKTDDFYDTYVDQKQVSLAKKESCVLGSRLAIWMLKEADFKIYLTASEELRAKRILGREGGKLEEIASFTQMRDKEDSMRYKKLYGIDNNQYDFVDMKVDTSCNVPEEILAGVLKELEKREFIVKE